MWPPESVGLEPMAYCAWSPDLVGLLCSQPRAHHERFQPDQNFKDGRWIPKTLSPPAATSLAGHAHNYLCGVQGVPSGSGRAGAWGWELSHSLIVGKPGFAGTGLSSPGSAWRMPGYVGSPTLPGRLGERPLRKTYPRQARDSHPKT